MCHIRSNFLFNLKFFPLLFGPFLFFYFILFFHRVVQAQLSCPHKIGLSFHVLDEVHLQTKAPNRKRIASVCFGALRDQRKWSMAIYAITGLNNFSMECSWKQQRKSVKQRSQYRTGGCTGLANGTMYFGYWSILVYRFKFTTK